MSTAPTYVPDTITPGNAPLGQDPVTWPTGTKSYLEDFVRLLIPTSIQSTIADIAWPTGSYLLVSDDLTAHTGEYVYTHPSTGLTYLYCNGAAVSQTTYATLYAFWGASKWAADSGGNFSLPDTRGRDLRLTDTTSGTSLGSTDANSSGSRPATHTHTGTSHTHGAGSYAVTLSGAGGGGTTAPPRADTNTYSVSGTSGSGGTGTTSASAGSYIYIGSLVVRF